MTKLIGVGIVPSTLLAALLVTASGAASAATSTTAGRDELSNGGDSAAVGVLQVAPGIYMLTVGGTNVAVETGPQGTVVVDSGSSGTSKALLDAIDHVKQSPIRYLIDTSADSDLVGGNARLARAGVPLLRSPGGVGVTADQHLGEYADIVAHNYVMTSMLAEPGANYPGWLLPSEAFSRAEYIFSLNGEPIAAIHEPAAHSGGDSIVRFERSDVVVTGDIFDITHFPIIDVNHGGSVQGEIAALNQLLNALVFGSTPIVTNTAGTIVIPVHGHLCGQADILTYRDMMIAVRDRIQSLINQRETLLQVEAADPTQGFDTRYGSDTGAWTTKDFVDAVYKSLTANKRAT